MTVTWAAFLALSVLGAATFFAAGLVLARQRATVLRGSRPLIDDGPIDTSGAQTRVLRAPPAANRHEDSVATLLSGGLGAAGPDELLRRISADAGVHSAVVSDELGLLVAGSGERAEELAALGGFLAGVGDRARQLGGLGTPTRVVIEDDRHTTLTAIHVPGAPLVAVTVRRELTPADSVARPVAARR